MTDGLVSIITPSYNSEKYISDTIESVLSQTYIKWEMIIVDDCSSDSTRNIISKYSRQDNRIKAFYLKENCGPAVARNEAIENAEGQYIAFLDSDDLWKPEKLEEQIEFMKSNDYCFTCTDYQYLKNNAKEKTKIFVAPKSLDYEQSLFNTAIGCLTVIIDRKITGDFRMPLVRAGQDHLTWWLLLKRGHKIYGLNKNLAEYRRVAGSVSHNKVKAVKRQWCLYRECEKLSTLKSIQCFLGYAWHAAVKYYM